ncbi:MAG TPA: hypothetical protein DHU96_01580 [Actinobacteria bacterium]|nr:hypothetical protein [Actinomycetota bacterium]
MVARADYGPAGPGQDRTAPQSIEAGDNDLPAHWLFAILVGCRSWHRQAHRSAWPPVLPGAPAHQASLAAGWPRAQMAVARSCQ